MNSEDYGWKPEVSKWYDEALVNKNNPNADIWNTIQSPENTFQTASWWLARKVIQDGGNFEVGYRKQIKHLVSREEVKGSFPFTQYIRELCQNALDAVMKDEHLTITLKIDESGMIFSHDGRTFQGPKPTTPEGEMASLYAPGMTTKKGSFNSEGRFGIGFKGWMLFFEEIKHKHSNGSQQIQIGYRFEGDGYNIDSLCLKGTEHSENQQVGPRMTCFEFTKPTNEFQQPTIDGIVREWAPMIRFANHGVTIKIEIMENKAEINHEVKTFEVLDNTLQQEFFESITATDLGSFDSPNRFMCTYTGCEPVLFDHIPDCPECETNSDVKSLWSENSEIMQYECKGDIFCGEFNLQGMPDCPDCEDDGDVIIKRTNPINEEQIIGIRSQIKRTKEIDTAISNFIEEERAHYSSLPNQELNPWMNVEVEHWYSQKRVTLAVNQGQTLDNSPWLFSMAEITSADEWPGTTFHGNSNWIIDGPFILSPTRKELKNDAIANSANAALLKFILSKCAPHLANYLFKQGLMLKLNKSTPFDIMFESEHRDPAINPFHGILFKPEIIEESVWGVNPQNYNDLFEGRTIYCNRNGVMINPKLIRRIPHSWKISGGTSLSEWIQEKEDVMLEHFDFIPYSMDNDNPEILNEENTSLTWTIPEIDKNRLYQILSDANLIQELADDFPKAVHEDWYKIPVEEEVKCFIFGREPPNSELLELIKTYAIDSTLRFIDENNELAHKFKQKKQTWVEIDGIYCLTALPDATDEWWFDRFVERIIRDQIVIPNEAIESMSLKINNSQDCSFFVAKVKAVYKNGSSNIELSAEELAIIPKKFNYKSNWTILSNTMTAWNINRQHTGGGLGLWKGVNPENYSQIICNDKIYICGENQNQYYCTYTEDNCRGIFEAEQRSENEPLMPDCPDCGDASDVIPHNQTLVGLLNERDYFAIMGEPINPATVISWAFDTLERLSTELGNYKSAIMMVNPYPQTELILGQLRNQNWTKIPTLSVTKHSNTLPSDFSYNDRGYYNQAGGDQFLKQNWANSEIGVNSDLANQYNTFYGHALNLHGNRQTKQKNVLIREIGLKELLLHSEWLGMNEFVSSTRLNAQINQDRIVNYKHLTAALIRVNRAGSRSGYSLKRASVRTTRQSTPAFENQELIPYEESIPLTDQGMCGFSETPVPEPIPWIISLMDDEEENGEEWKHFEETQDLKLIHHSEIKVETLPEDDILRTGLCMGILKVIDEILEQETEFGTCLLIEFAKMIHLFDSTLLEETSIFKQLNSCNLGIQIEQKKDLLDLLEDTIQESDSDNDLTALVALKSSLQGVQAQTWQSALEVINELETNEEKWALFYASKILPPNPAVFQYRTQYNDFRRMGESCRINPSYGFISNSNAFSLFGLKSDAHTEDAGSWAIPGGSRIKDRICIMVQELEGILDCDGAVEYTIGKVDLRGVLENTERNVEEVEINSQWGFAQLLIALRSAQISDESDFEPFMPRLGEREMNHPCEVFTGKQINLGKGGWDLCANSTEGQPKNMQLVTNSIEQGPKRSLLQLIKKLGIRLSWLRNMSIQDDEGIQLLATTFEMDFSELKQQIDILKRKTTGILLNPWHGGESNESGKWDLLFGRKPQWRSNKDEAIERVSARKLLKRYTAAIHALLMRGDLGPARNDDTQKLIKLLPNARDEIKSTLYPNVGSLLADEPIVYPPGEMHTEMGNIQRKIAPGDERELLKDSALEHFLGNLLFLSRFSAHRGTMYAREFGLKERNDQTIQFTLHQMLNRPNAWGNEETILLRDVMQIGPGNYLSLRLHKYHAICMVALDDAFDRMREEEE
jgi:hypothetical protein